MPRRHLAAPDPTKATLHALAPELALLAAVIQQAVADIRSPRPDIRAEARRFLGDEEALMWWGQQLGVEDALQQHVRHVLRDGP